MQALLQSGRHLTQNLDFHVRTGFMKLGLPQSADISRRVLAFLQAWPQSTTRAGQALRLGGGSCEWAAAVLDPITGN